MRNPIRRTRNPTSVSLQEEDLVQKPSVICTGQDQQEQHDDCSREEQQRQDTESQAYEKRLVKKNEPRPHTTKIIFLESVSAYNFSFFFFVSIPSPHHTSGFNCIDSPGREGERAKGQKILNERGKKPKRKKKNSRLAAPIVAKREDELLLNK